MRIRHGLIAAALVLVAGVTALVLTDHPAPSVSTAAHVSAPPIGDLTCDQSDHPDTPVTAHLSILVNGRARDIPADIGYADALVDFGHGTAKVSRSACAYWIHTGSDDGVLHADPPAGVHRTFTLGDFFDVWRQPLGTHTVATTDAPVTAYVNGARFDGNPRTIPLTEHAVIQLDAGTPTPPAPYAFPQGG